MILIADFFDSLTSSGFDLHPQKGEIREALKSVLRRVTPKFSISERYAGIASSSPAIAPEIYAVFDTTHQTLTTENGYVDLISVEYDGVQLRKVPFVDLQSNVGYYSEMDNVIYFHEDFTYDRTKMKLHIIVSEGFISDDGTEVLVPEQMFEYLKSIVIMELTVKGKYKDPDLFAYYGRINRSEFRMMMKLYRPKTRDYRLSFGAVAS